MIPLEIRIRSVSEIVEPGTNTFATGIPSVKTPWNRKVPMRTWLILHRLVDAPPIRIADAAIKPIWRGAVYSCIKP
jgi:hypothetical protein